MSQSLSAESESFFASIGTVFFISHNMYPLVRVRVSFVLVFIITEIAVKPNSMFVLFYMPVQVAHIFEVFVTVLFHTLQASISLVSDFVLGETTFKW